MPNFYLSCRSRKDKQSDAIYFYAVRNIYHPDTKKQSKEQISIGRFSNGRCHFRNAALEHADLFKGTQYERAYWVWRETLDERSSDGVQDVVACDSIVNGDIRRAGVSLILNKVASDLELDRTLTTAFGKDLAERILSMAYYLSLLGRNPAYLFAKWNQNQVLPHDLLMSEKDISKIMSEITSENLTRFQSLWVQRFSEHDCLSMDITSISSYGRNVSDVSFGYNRDGEKLPQINLLMVVSQSPLLPVWFESLPGAINDISAVEDAVRIMQQLHCGSRRLVLDRGFASAENIAYLQKKGIKFTMGIPLHRFSEFRQAWLDAKAAGAFARPECSVDLFDADDVLGSFFFNKTLKLNGHRCYLHLFDCPWYRVKNEIDVQQDVDRIYRMLLKEVPLKSQHDQQIANECFTVKKTPVRGLKVTSNPQAIMKLKNELAGAFVILSNMQKDSQEALRIYKLRDGIEKRYDDLKNDLDMFRLRVHSPHNMRARLFLQFIAEILRCRILNQVQQIEKSSKFAALRKKTVTDILWTMDPLMRVQLDTHHAFYMRPTKDQRLILEFFGIDMTSRAWSSAR